MRITIDESNVVITDRTPGVNNSCGASLPVVRVTNLVNAWDTIAAVAEIADGTTDVVEVGAPKVLSRDSRHLLELLVMGME